MRPGLHGNAGKSVCPEPMKPPGPADRYARIAILDQTSPAPQADNDL